MERKSTDIKLQVSLIYSINFNPDMLSAYNFQNDNFQNDFQMFFHYSK